MMNRINWILFAERRNQRSGSGTTVNQRPIHGFDVRNVDGRFVFPQKLVNVGIVAMDYLHEIENLKKHKVRSKFRENACLRKNMFLTCS